MTERPHMHSHLHGERMANSMPIRRRRKTAEELAAMQPEDRFMYEAANPLTDEEQYAALRREMDGLDYAVTGDLPPQVILDNEPPTDWGN